MSWSVHRHIALLAILEQHSAHFLNSLLIWQTSIVTHGATLAFFQRHSYFGLPPADCFFFQQSELPALSNTGKIMLETRSKVALAPNGNGGIFEGLKRQGALADMKQHGVEYIHVYGVDNVLALVGDPTFIGFSVSKGADCANKVVRKTRPDEKVGVMCLRGGKPSVVEYSELPQAMSVLRSDTDHQLVYSAANIVQHFFTYSFLEHHAEQPLPYHVARKAIPYVERDGTLVTPTAPSGLKLELFVFDAFERSLSMHCLAVAREEEFAPVKNAAGKGVQDSPVTARQALSDLHCERLRRAGATLVPSSGACDADAAQCEISPLVSYAGEGLQQLVQGQTIQLPYHLDPTTVKALQP
jgi:UDP-N-acetylglucosamine/UDP-N-acetylgalactosamine diphosphorylase